MLLGMWVFGLVAPVVVVMAMISPLGAAVAIVLTLIGLLVIRGGVSAAFDGWAGLEFIGSWIGSRRRGRGTAGLDWFCSVCRSLNHWSAETCYRRCGPREQIERVGAHAVPLEPSAGRAQRDRRHG